MSNNMSLFFARLCKLCALWIETKQLSLDQEMEECFEQFLCMALHTLLHTQLSHAALKFDCSFVKL